MRLRRSWPWGNADVPSRNYLVRQVTTLLELARRTNDHNLAATVLDKAASLTEKLDDPPLEATDVSPRAPDVDPGKQA
jgi:hypothetical protein